MKRSEMLLSIRARLARGVGISFFTSINGDNFHDKIEMLALFMLGHVEEHGMLPPTTNWLVDNHPEKMHWSEVGDYHLWEPEEEEIYVNT